MTAGPRQLVQAGEIEVRLGHQIRVVPVDGAPGAAADEGGAQSRAPGRAQVVVEAVADVQDASGAAQRAASLGARDGVADFDDLGEERGVGLLQVAPHAGGGDQVHRQVERFQDAVGRRGLVRGYQDQIAGLLQGGQGAARVRVQIALAVALGAAREGPRPALGGEVEARPEVLEGLQVRSARGDDGAEDGREGVARDAQPVGPVVVLDALVHERLPDVEDDRVDGA